MHLLLVLSTFIITGRTQLMILFSAVIFSFLFFSSIGVDRSVYALSDFNFAAVGDFGCTSNTDATITNIRGKNPELVLGLGDYSYASSGSCWFDKIDPIQSITKISIGNHEDASDEGFSGYMSHFGLSQTYYSYNHENTHFLVMDSDRNVYSSGSPQHTFVINDLQSASQNPDIDWIIVYIHQWLYKSDSTNSINDDLVLSGHSHIYHRSYPLKINVNNPSNPIITNNNAKDYIDPPGEIYAIVGTGGINLQAIDGASPFMANAQDDFFGQLDIKITNNGGKLEGKFYRNGNNAVLDSFSITKGSGNTGSYNYAPGLVLTGSNYNDTPNAANLQLNQFSVAAWFKTSSNFASDAFIVNKGGVGSDSAGQNLNYGIWMTSTEQIKAGFETSSGADQYVTSPNTYNDGQWHYAMVTNDGSSVILHIDGVQVGIKSTTGASPESTGTKPARVGANSRVTPPSNLFTGEVDEVRIWKDDLTALQASNAFAGASFNRGEQVLHLPFGSGSSPPVVNNQNLNTTKNVAKSITLTGTDPESDVLAYTIVTPPTNGTLSGTAPNLNYDPDTNFVGSDFFTFKANDGTSDSNIATVSINVIEPPQGSYNYAPTLVLTGSNYNDTPNAANLQLNQFSVAAWFKTSSNFASDAFIVNKGGSGSEAAGQNLNYGIWMTSTEQIKAGFETTSGADVTVTSPNTYNDGQWHYAVVTNDGAIVRLHVDGIEVATKSTGGNSPESSGTKSVRVGANSRVTPPGNFFIGEVDEVRVWSDDLSVEEVGNAFAGNNFNAVEQRLYLPFGGSGGGGYNYAPSLVLTGSNFNDTPNAASLQLNQFSLAAWFKTSTNFASDAFIANKGGVGSDSAGQNLNYGIWITSSEQIKVGFETGSGADQYVTSSSTYNDGQWHYVVVTNDGVNVILYIDGVQEGTKSTSGATPEQNSKPFRVGANSRVTPPNNFFTGDVDEVRIWNSALSPQEVSNSFAGTFKPGHVLYLDFSSTALSSEYQYEPSLELSGPN